MIAFQAVETRVFTGRAGSDQIVDGVFVIFVIEVTRLQHAGDRFGFIGAGIFPCPGRDGIVGEEICGDAARPVSVAIPRDPVTGQVLRWILAPRTTARSLPVPAIQVTYRSPSFHSHSRESV